MLKLLLQGSVFVNDQNMTMIDSMSISIMTHIRPRVPAAFKFTNSISTEFWTEEVFKKKDSLKTNCYYIQMLHHDKYGQDMDKTVRIFPHTQTNKVW